MKKGGSACRFEVKKIKNIIAIIVKVVFVVSFLWDAAFYETRNWSLDLRTVTAQ